MTSMTGYLYWANCGLKSSVTIEDSKEIAPGLRMISSTTLTLCAVHPDKVVLDMVVRNRVEGGSVEFPSSEILQELEIPADLGPSPEPSFESYSESNEDGSWGIAETSSVPFPEAVREGDETLPIAGRSIPCHWAERHQQQGNHRMTIKTWISDEIPGGLARTEFRSEGPSPLQATSVVVAFEKKSEP
jgi:hypothetical protein